MEDKKEYCVYLHTTPSLKYYVGITKLKPKYRWNNGKSYNDYFKHAVLKYGWGNIKHEILLDKLSEKEAKAKEIEIIAKYKSNNILYGYNLTIGGDSLCGINNPMYGKNHSEYSKQRMSRNKIGKNKGKENIRSKPVINIDTGEIFDCVNAVTRKYGYNHGAISNCCLGRISLSYGQHWAYINNEHSISDLRGIRKKIYQYDRTTGAFIKQWESAIEVASYLGINAHTVRNCCQGSKRTKAVGGFIWLYEYYVNLPNEILLKHKNNGKRSVMNKTTNELFSSVTEAAKKYGYKHINLWMTCANRSNLCPDYEWAFV